MNWALGIALVIILCLYIWFRMVGVRLRKQLNETKASCAREIEQMKERTAAALADAEESLKKEAAAAQEENERIRRHFQEQADRDFREMSRALAEANAQIEAFGQLRSLAENESEVRAALAAAIEESEELRTQAQAVLESAKAESTVERSAASQKAREIRQQAEGLLGRATVQAGEIVSEAHRKAEQIAGDAYTALRDREHLAESVKAIRNVIDGYGDRYVVPTRSLLDDLAADFGHLEAGQSLSLAREQTRAMVEQGLAAACDYVERNRRDTAIRFVVDAFNGRVDAILSRTKHDNYGTLEQEIRDVFSFVNLNGEAFRNARILPAFLDARLAELKWAVVAQELRLREREEQRQIKEQIREEERARREYDRAMKEAQREESILRQALEKARREVESATEEKRLQLEQQLADLALKLSEAEAKNLRALSMAQQTRKGNVYIISNIGSFGEDIFKIGMTRRLEPMDRVRELGDASVPFDFDVHAIIPSEDAPALESDLHNAFSDLRVNQVNHRKEFFRVPLQRVRELVQQKGVDASFTMTAEAFQYRESQAISKMSPEERIRYRLKSSTDASRRSVGEYVEE